MKRRILPMIMAVIMIMSIIQVPAWATDGDGAFVEMSIGEESPVQYDNQETFFQAFQAAKGNIFVKLLSDVEISGYIPVVEGQNVTLDLNGCKLSTTEESTGRHHYAIKNYGILFIEDSAGEGTIRARGVQNLDEGVMVINDGTFIDVDENGGAAVWNEADLTINGGTFKTEHIGSASDQYGPGCLNNSGNALITGVIFEVASKRTSAFISTGELEITPDPEKEV